MSILKLKLTEFLAPSSACHFARARFTERQSQYPHTHDFVEVFWVERGQGWHGINGQRRPLRTGAVFFVRAEDRHDFSCDRHGGVLEIANLAFATRAWSQLRRRYFPGRALAWEPAAVEPRETQLPPAALQQLRTAGDELSAGVRNLAALDRFLLNLLHLTDPAQPGVGTAMASTVPVPSWIQRACDHARRQENFADGVSALARHAARSPAHVSRQWQRHLGCTPTQWINYARMTFAAEQLVGSDVKILDLVADCGIQNPRHFYALFHARFGLTPRQFRLREQRVLKPSAPG